MVSTCACADTFTVYLAITRNRKSTFNLHSHTHMRILTLTHTHNNNIISTTVNATIIIYHAEVTLFTNPSYHTDNYKAAIIVNY